MPPRSQQIKDTQNVVKTISKQVNIYIRRHPFVLASTESFTTSQRRAFLRDVYDYSRSSGLSRPEAKRQIVKARQICGEDDYFTDESAMENEIDDSEAILEHVQEYKVNGLPHPGPNRESSALAGSHSKKPTAGADGDPKGTAQKRKRNGDNHDASAGSTATGHSSLAQTAIMSTSFNRQSSLPSTIADHDEIDMSSGGGKQKSFTAKQLEVIEPSKRSQNSSFKYPERQPQARPTSTSASEKQQKTPHIPSRTIKADFVEDSRPSHAVPSNSSQNPATVPADKTSKKDQQNFTLPEVAMFSDDEE